MGAPGMPPAGPGMPPPGAEAGPMEAGGQEGAENVPPTEVPESVDYSSLRKLMLKEGLSLDAVKIIEEMSRDN
jgi:hypothetical protein